MRKNRREYLRLFKYAAIWLLCAVVIGAVPFLGPGQEMPAAYYFGASVILISISIAVLLSAKLRVYLMQQFLFASLFRLDEKTDIQDLLEIRYKSILSDCVERSSASNTSGQKAVALDEAPIFSIDEDPRFALLPATLLTSEGEQAKGYYVTVFAKEKWHATPLLIDGPAEVALEKCRKALGNSSAPVAPPLSIRGSP